jgi:hypothetical protein
MDADYFAPSPPPSSGPKDELGRPLPSRSEPVGWLDGLFLLGRIVYFLGMVLVAMLPFAGIYAIFLFLKSLPF